MANYLEKYNNAQNVNFMARVRMALLARVQAAALDGSSTPAQANRIKTGKMILQDLDKWVILSCQFLASLGLSNASTDAEIDAAINAMTDPIAAVFSNAV